MKTTTINKPTHDAIAAWLRSLTSVTEVKPCTVTIGKQSWPAAFYRQEFKYTAGMTCVQRGEHKAGESYFQTGIYCVGKLPQIYVKSKNACFPHDDADWYVACYIEEVKPVVAWAHPFGANFILKAWNLPEAIDKYDKTYRRVALVVEYMEVAHV